MNRAHVFFSLFNLWISGRGDLLVSTVANTKMVLYNSIRGELTRYNCAYESDDDKTHVLTVDKNDDGTYFKMSIDVENNGTNEEYTRTQAAGSFDIDGIDDGLSEILGNAKQARAR